MLPKKRKRLSRQEKEDVRQWLETKSGSGCPFYYANCFRYRRTCEGICSSWFPRCNGWNCPCQKYPLKTVVARAKKMIGRKETGEL